MRLDFNVLWVDDQPDQLQSQATAIAKGMQDYGFNLNRTMCRTMDEIRDLVAGDGLFTDEVDLILVDWDLGAEQRGQDVIATVREKVLYKDVIFYSSRTEVTHLRRFALEAGVEGVFCATKRDLVEEVMGVFESLVKKVLDLDHTRGIVMGATSDIDHMVISCLTILSESGTEEQRIKLLTKAKKLLSNSLKENEKKARELLATGSLSELLKSHALFTANHRLRVLNKAIKAAQYDGHGSLRQGLKTYIEKVVPKRNELGHLVLHPDGKPGSTYIDAVGRPITLEEMRELRCLLLNIRSDFRKLLDTLGSST